MPDIADRAADMPPSDPSKPDTPSNMVSVPILRGFDASDPLGWLQIRRDALPATPDWCFGVGYRVEAFTNDEITGYSLQSVAIIPDADYRKVIDREQARQDTPQLYGSQERILRRRARAFGIARDVADGFAARRGEGGQTATYRQLVNMLLSEPEVVTAIADWRQAAREAVDAVDQAQIPAGYSDHERPSATLARHEQLAVRCTLSAHHEEWWRLHRDLQQSQRELIALIADGFKARRKAAAGMNLSQGKPGAVHASPVIVETTAMWAGAQTAQSDGAVHFSAEAWAKFVKCLGEEPPLEILTSPGTSAPESVVHQRCKERGCQEALPCPQGKCAMGPGEPT